MHETPGLRFFTSAVDVGGARILVRMPIEAGVLVFAEVVPHVVGMATSRGPAQEWAIVVLWIEKPSIQALDRARDIGSRRVAGL